jgi:hypothetical protein
VLVNVAQYPFITSATTFNTANNKTKTRTLSKTMGHVVKITKAKPDAKHPNQHWFQIEDSAKGRYWLHEQALIPVIHHITVANELAAKGWHAIGDTFNTLSPLRPVLTFNQANDMNYSSQLYKEALVPPALLTEATEKSGLSPYEYHTSIHQAQ